MPGPNCPSASMQNRLPTHLGSTHFPWFWSLSALTVYPCLFVFFKMALNQVKKIHLGFDSLAIDISSMLCPPSCTLGTDLYQRDSWMCSVPIILQLFQDVPEILCRTFVGALLLFLAVSMHGDLTCGCRNFDGSSRTEHSHATSKRS